MVLLVRFNAHYCRALPSGANSEHTMLYRRRCECVCVCVRAVFFLCCMKFHKSLNSLFGRSSNKENDHIDVYLYSSALLFDHQRNQNHNEEEKKLRQSASGSTDETCLRVNFVCDERRDSARWPKKEKKEMATEMNESRTTATHLHRNHFIHGTAWYGKVFRCRFILIQFLSSGTHISCIAKAQKWQTNYFDHARREQHHAHCILLKRKKKLVKRYVIPSKQVNVSCQR